MITKNIEFDEMVTNEAFETTTFYFIAPKELLKAEYPEAESAEISIEVPSNNILACLARVCISPTKYEADDECYVDYDWNDLELPIEDIEELLTFADKSIRSRKRRARKIYRMKKKPKLSYLSQLKPIEFDIFSEPDEGHNVLFLGQKKFRDIYNELKKQLEEVNLTQSLDYILCDWEDELPSIYSIRSFVTWGSCEGVYVDVKIWFKIEDKTVEKSLITAKTLGQKPEDYEKMGRLATAIAYLLNC